MIVPVIVRREVMNICLATETELFESPDITQFDFCLWGWMKAEVYKRKVDTWEKLLACHFGCHCQHKGTWKSTQTNNTRSSHTSCRVHWGWRNFPIFIV